MLINKPYLKLELYLKKYHFTHSYELLWRVWILTFAIFQIQYVVWSRTMESHFMEKKKNSVLIIRIFIACKDLQTPKIIRFLAHINTCTIYCKYHNSFARKISIYYCNRTRKRKRTVVHSSRNVALFILHIAVILNSYIPCTIQFTSMLITYS